MNLPRCLNLQLKELLEDLTAATPKNKYANPCLRPKIQTLVRNSFQNYCPPTACCTPTPYSPEPV